MELKNESIAKLSAAIAAKKERQPKPVDKESIASDVRDLVQVLVQHRVPFNGGGLTVRASGELLRQAGKEKTDVLENGSKASPLEEWLLATQDAEDLAELKQKLQKAGEEAAGATVDALEADTEEIETGESEVSPA